MEILKGTEIQERGWALAQEIVKDIEKRELAPAIILTALTAALNMAVGKYISDSEIVGDDRVTKKMLIRSCVASFKNFSNACWKEKNKEDLIV